MIREAKLPELRVLILVEIFIAVQGKEAVISILLILYFLIYLKKIYK